MVWEKVGKDVLNVQLFTFFTTKIMFAITERLNYQKKVFLDSGTGIGTILVQM